MIQDPVNYAVRNFRIKSRHFKIHNMGSHHFHDSYELYYLISGTRQFFINDATYLVKSGSLALIEPQTLHKTMDTGEEHSGLLINFKRNFLPFDNSDQIFKHTFEAIHIVPLPYTLQARIDTLYKTIIKEVNLQTIGSEARIQSLLLEILIEVARYVQIIPENKQTHSSVDEKVIEIANYIKTNYGSTITLESLSEDFFISRYYLSHIFKRATGFTIFEYIHSIRIVEAQKLLRETDKKVIEIAELVGFNNMSNFGKVFKTITNQTPLNYRKCNEHDFDY